MSAIDVYSRNAQGQIVLHGKVWSPAYGPQLILSVYAYVGIKSKRPAPALVRDRVLKYQYNEEVLHTILHNLAHLWAMENGVNDFEFRTDKFDIHKYLFHPSQLTEESQP